MWSLRLLNASPKAEPLATKIDHRVLCSSTINTWKHTLTQKPLLPFPWTPDEGDHRREDDSHAPITPVEVVPRVPPKSGLPLRSESSRNSRECLSKDNGLSVSLKNGGTEMN